MAGHNKQCVARLQKEYKSLLKEPVPHITAHPSPNNLLEWHFVLEGDSTSEFKDGVYHGKIAFPPEYPFKPPSLSLYTPNGRFATNTKLCLSMTDFHPESWNPMWSVGTILTGLLSFMNDTQRTTGSIDSSKEEKVKLAAQSLAFNMKSPMFRKLFPEWVAAHEVRQQQAAQPAAPPAAPQEAAAAAATQSHAELAADSSQAGQTLGHGPGGGGGGGLGRDAPPAGPQAVAAAQDAAGGPQGAAAAPPAAGAAAGAGSAGASGSGSEASSSSLWVVAAAVVVLALVLVPLYSAHTAMVSKT
ncbi:hypothetical protein V8C86DRAFT_2527320 [Haematococcus lacustris]